MPYISDLPNGNAIQNADLFVATRGNQTVVISGSQIANATAIGSRLTALETSTVVPGTYVIPRITVNAQGRITQADSGTIAIPTHISELIDDVGLALNGNISVAPGTYTSPTLEIGLDGRIKSITNGSALPSGGTVGQVLVKTGSADGAATWQTIALGSGTGTGTVTVTAPSTPFPRAAQFTDYSVYGRESTSTPLTLANSGDGITFQDLSGDTRGYKSSLRPIPTAPTAAKPFEFIANFSATYGNAQYNIEGIAVADANNNIQIWGINGGNSGREDAGTASYGNNGSWSDGDYYVPASGDGTWFRMVVDDTSMKLYRGKDGETWTLKETYSIPGRGFGAITRYGFVAHHYTSGTTDLVTVTKAYSTEFPKAVEQTTGSSNSFKAYRLRFDSTQSMSYASIAEVEFREVAGVAQTATGGTAFSTATGNNTTAGAAFNGDLTDRWVGDYPDKPFPKYVGYIFSSAKTIVEVMLAASGYSSEAPLTYGIEASNDTTTGLDGTWTELGKVATGTNWNDNEKRTLALTPPSASSTTGASKSFKTYRLNLNGIQGGYGYAFSELTFLDASGAVIPTTGATATASGTKDASRPPSNLIDGSAATYWDFSPDYGANQTTPAWVEVTFPSAVTVGSFSITARNDATNPSDAAITGVQVSKDFNLEGTTDNGTVYTLGKFRTVTPYGIGEVRTFKLP